MKHCFAPNPDLEICPSLRRSQNCRWGRQTQPGKSIAINKEQRVCSDPCLYRTSDFLISTFPGLSPAQGGALPRTPARLRLFVTAANKILFKHMRSTWTQPHWPHCRWLYWSVLVTTFTVSQSFLNPFIVQLFLYSTFLTF